MDRVRFITHRGAKVLLADFSGCEPADVVDLTDQVQELVTAEPPNSVLVVADFTNAKLDRAAVDRIKVATARDLPHVRRAAWVGAESMPEVWFNAIRNFSTRDFVRFATRDQALDWIATIETDAAASD